MSGPLSRRQAAVLEFLRAYIAEHGFAPTHRDICKHFGIVSPNGVHGHLHSLEAKGYIRRIPNVARAIVIVA